MVARIKGFHAVIPAPFGALGVIVEDALVSIDLLHGSVPRRTPSSALAREVCAQLRAYLRNSRHVFDLPLASAGSSYQQRVRRALLRVPPGTVVTYGSLAHQLQSGARAVGAACRANPVPIVVPCHRVVARNGMGGFMGKGDGSALVIKRWLLTHERV